MEGVMDRQAVIYIRVSTERQAQEGVSMESQEAKCRAWCDALGYQVVGTFTDAGISGKRMDKRPGLLDALDTACHVKAALVVYSLSRLARSTRDALAISERLDKAGADLVSLTEKLDTTTAAGKMLFRILAVLSEFERDLASERTKAALSHKRATGYKTGGDVPWGYTVAEDGKLTEDDAEQGVIALMRSWHGCGTSLRGICAELQRKGIPTKTGAAVWHPYTVAGILGR
jgi:DNA invertase Pin-like site-specific DNA recombinase